MVRSDPVASALPSVVAFSHDSSDMSTAELVEPCALLELTASDVVGDFVEASSSFRNVLPTRPFNKVSSVSVPALCVASDPDALLSPSCSFKSSNASVIDGVVNQAGAISTFVPSVVIGTVCVTLDVSALLEDEVNVVDSPRPTVDAPTSPEDSGADVAARVVSTLGSIVVC